MEKHRQAFAPRPRGWSIRRVTRAAIATGALAAVLLALVVGYVVLQQRSEPAAPASTATTSETVAAEAHPSFLYGRITVDGGATYEGRLRWGRDQEAFWGDYFNGFKDENPWAVHVPPEQLRNEPDPIEIFGVVVARRERPIELGRPFMARFGDISRIELVGADVRVTLKSGTRFDLDWNAFNDFDDGVRVWDGLQGVVDLAPAMARTLPGTGGGRDAHATSGRTSVSRVPEIGTHGLKGGPALSPTMRFTV